MDVNNLLELALQQGIWAAAFITVGIFIFNFFKATIEDLKKFQDKTMQQNEDRESRLMAVIESFSSKFESIEKTQNEMRKDINNLTDVVVREVGK